MQEIDWKIIHDVLRENVFIRVLLTIWVALILQVIARVTIGKLINRSVKRRRNMSAEDAKKQKQTLKGVIYTMSAVIIWVVTFFVVVTFIGVNVAALLTGAGLFGVIFGFGAQGIIKDFVTGLFILGENQYRVGDIVEITTPSGAVSGVVEDLTIRVTRLRDLDGNLYTVSNGLAQAVKNYSFQYANVNVNLRVAYDSDIDKVEAVINRVGESMLNDEEMKKVISEPIAFLRIDAFEDFGIVVKALGKVKPAHQWEVAAEFRREIKKAFDKEGIEIPLPQMIIYEANGRKKAKV